MGGGTYALLLVLDEALDLTVGSMGRLVMPAGSYIYAGSARQGLGPRLARHARAGKRIHWHVDHLTTRPECRALGAFVFGPCGPDECRIAAMLTSLDHAAVDPPRFGASDCRCAGHLVSLGHRPEVVERAAATLEAAGGHWLSFDGVRRPGTRAVETEVGTGQDH